MTARALGLVAVLVSVSGPVWQDAPSPDGAGAAFGYQVGEERRYVLGPPESLWNGESAAWGIALDRLTTFDAEPAAVFRLWHERRTSGATTTGSGSDAALDARVDAELTVNSHAFPVLLRFKTRRLIHGGGADEFTVQYAYRDWHFLKTVWGTDEDWTTTIPLTRHASLDDSVPVGLYVFSLTAIDCLTPGYVDFQDDVPAVEDSNPCENNDPAFVNPGLFSLALPVFWEGGAKDRDYLFFTPTGAALYPAATGLDYWFRGGGSSGVAVQGQLGSARREGVIDTVTDPRHYYETARVRLGERTRIELGRRQMDAWRLAMDGPIREIFVDEEYRVLRATLPPDPVSGGSRWIRLLFPTEY